MIFINQSFGRGMSFYDSLILMRQSKKPAYDRHLTNINRDIDGRKLDSRRHSYLTQFKYIYIISTNIKDKIIVE